jgi:hypothetical protein
VDGRRWLGHLPGGVVPLVDQPVVLGVPVQAAQRRDQVLGGAAPAVGLWELLRDPSRGPVLMLATLWDGEWRKLTGLPDSGEPDSHALARGLLAGHEIIVPAVSRSVT